MIAEYATLDKGQRELFLLDDRDAPARDVRCHHVSVDFKRMFERCLDMHNKDHRHYPKLRGGVHIPHALVGGMHYMLHRCTYPAHVVEWLRDFKDDAPEGCIIVDWDSDAPSTCFVIDRSVVEVL